MFIPLTLESRETENLDHFHVRAFGFPLCRSFGNSDSMRSLQISERFETQWKLNSISDPNRAHVRFADLMTQLFEIVAEVLKTHQPLVETYYGPGRLLPLLQLVQAECDRQARRVLEQFETARNYDRLVHQVRLLTSAGGQAGNQMER